MNRYTQVQGQSQNLQTVTSTPQATYRPILSSQQYPGTPLRQLVPQNKAPQNVACGPQRQQPLVTQNKGGQSMGTQRVINTPPQNSPNAVFPVAITANPHTIVNQYQVGAYIFKCKQFIYCAVESVL